MPVANALLLDLAPPERRQSVLALNYTAMSVAYTLGVMPAGYVAEQGYGLLARPARRGLSSLVAALYALLCAACCPSSARRRMVLVRTACRDRERCCASPRWRFIFPFSMGLVVSASPLFAADAGLGEGYIGLVLGANSILVALLALPVAARIEASGPFRFLGAAALIVAAAHACYAAIPGAAAALLVGTIVFSFAELVFSSAVPATRGAPRAAGPARRLPGRLGAGRLAQHGQRALPRAACCATPSAGTRRGRVLPPSPLAAGAVAHRVRTSDSRNATRSSISAAVSLQRLQDRARRRRAAAPRSARE